MFHSQAVTSITVRISLMFPLNTAISRKKAIVEMVSSTLSRAMYKSRTQFTLRPTTFASASGVPRPAGLNLNVHWPTSHDDAHDEPLPHKLRSNYGVPSFSIRSEINPITGLMSRSPLNGTFTEFPFLLFECMLNGACVQPT